MKYAKYLVLLLIAIQFIGCKKNPAPTAPKTPQQNEIQNRVRASMGSCVRLYAEAKYDSVKIVGKKGLAAAPVIYTNERLYLHYIVGFAYSATHENDSAVSHYYKALAIAIQTKSSYIFPVQVQLEHAYYDMGKPDSVNVYKDKMIAEADTLKQGPEKMTLITELANIYFTSNQPEKALQADFKILAYYESKKDSGGIGRTLIALSNVSQQLFYYKRAEGYLLKSIAYIKRDQAALMFAYDNLSICYRNMSNYEKEKEADEKIAGIAISIRDTAKLEATYLAMAVPLIELKQYEKATKYLNRGLAYYNRTKKGTPYATVLLTFANMESEKGNYQKAIVWYEKSVSVAKRTGQIDNLPGIYQALARVADSAKLYQKAYFYELTYNKLKDSLIKTTEKKTIEDLEIKYQTNQKEQKIKLLNQVARLKDVELTDEKRKWWSLLAVVGFLLVTAFLLYRSYRLKKDSNKLLEEKNKALNVLNAKLNEANSSKTKLFSILSHDLRAPVGNLFSFLNLQKNHSNKLTDKQQSEHNDRIIHSAENLMESMEDLLIWSKSQMDSFSLNLREVNVSELIGYVITMHQDFANKKQLKLEGGCPKDLVLLTDENFLKIVLRNIVSNAIKFTPQGGLIRIAATEKDQWVELKISDNGPGLTKAQIDNVFEWNSIRSDSSGLGLKLAKEFITRLGGSIGVDSNINAGTTFIVAVPVLQSQVINA